MFFGSFSKPVLLYPDVNYQNTVQKDTAKSLELPSVYSDVNFRVVLILKCAVQTDDILIKIFMRC